jgi:hypothetical protein
MKFISTKIVALALLSSVVIACKKEKETTTPISTTPTTPATTTTPTVNNGKFTWIENNVGSTNDADSARYSFQYKTIYAFKLGVGTSFKIIITGNTPNTYTIGASNTFTLSKGSVAHKATSGSVVINDNTNGKITGAYNVTMNTGGLTNVKGEFTEVPTK